MSKKPKTRYSLGYLVSQAFKGIFRNGMMTFASVLVLVCCLTVMGTFALLVYNIDFNLDQLGELNQVVVFCDMDTTDEQVEEIGRRIRLLDNIDEESVKLITKEMALIEEKQKYHEFTDLFDQMEEGGVNPYPDSYVIEYEDNSKVTAMQMELEQIEGISKVQCRADIAKTIENIKNTVIFVFVCFLAILFLVSVFIIINTIKLAIFSRRQEITVMRYVGATRWFITTPFIMEGTIIALVSGALSYAIEYFLYRAAYNAVKTNGIIELEHFSLLQPYVLAGIFGIAVFISSIGTYISLRKHLKA